MAIRRITSFVHSNFLVTVMKINYFNIEKVIGILLIIGALGVLIPFIILSVTFEYPDILRQDTTVILTKFHEGGSQLIWTWLAFALAGLPLVPAMILLGKILENESPWANVATAFGIVALVTQMLGLLRWVFVVPLLAEQLVNTPNAVTKIAVITAFQVVHQWGGVLLGEQVGQLFTILWTVLLTTVLYRAKLVNKGLAGLGYLGSAIYFMAQAELLAMVIPDFPYWGGAAPLGSTLWLAWLMILGGRLWRINALATHFS